MKYLIIYLEVEHLLNFLSQDEKGDLFDILINYAKDETIPKIENKRVLNVFNFLKPRLDSQFEKAKLKAEVARVNGASGGRPGKPKIKKPNKTQQNPTKPTGFTPPTLQEVQNYCIERNNQIDPVKFFDYYNAGNWSDAKGNKIKNWKQKLITWENKTTGGGGVSQPDAKNLCELINKMAGASYLTAITTVNNNAVLHFKSLEDREKLRSLENIQEIKNKISSELGTGGIETEIRS